MGWRGAAGLLILAVSAFRVAYVGWWSPLDLAQDEAHYWDWARNLDWSYYSKGPLVAWLIRGSLELFGPLSVSLTDSTILAIRFPAVLCGAALLAAIYTLTVQTTGRESLAFATTAVTAAMPAVTAAGILMTIDAPFVALWAWACVFGHAALFGKRAWAWPALGLTLGLGILAKYTMLVWPASAVLFCLFTPAYRSVLLRPGVGIAAAVAAFCCLPILIWNIQNDWVSLRHVAGQAGVAGAEAKGGIRWLGPLEFLGAQLGVGLGVFFVAMARAMIAHRPGADADPKRLYLWWLSAPTFALFFLVSFRVGIQVNWPAAGYVSGMALSAAWLAERVALPDSRPWKIAVAAGAVVAILGTVVALQPSTVRPVAGSFMGPPTEKSPAPMRRWDPTCRLRGWKWLAGEVDRMRDELTKRDGVEPVLAVDRWNKAGELGYYCLGNPTVVCLGRAVGDRYSQYDLWRPNPIDDAQAYAGKTFLIVGEPKDGYSDAFAGYDERNLTTLEYREDGELVAWWYVTVGRGYRGFPADNRGRKY